MTEPLRARLTLRAFFAQLGAIFWAVGSILGDVPWQFEIWFWGWRDARADRKARRVASRS